MSNHLSAVHRHFDANQPLERERVPSPSPGQSIASELGTIHSILNVNITWKCPVRCTYCHIKSRASLEDRTVLTEADLVRACTDARDLRFSEYRISGGEPTVTGSALFGHARVIHEITGHKPILLTSGVGITDQWMKNAAELFGGIYISVENPLKPMQTVVPWTKGAGLIRDCQSDSLPFQFGLTMVEEAQFCNIVCIFETLFDAVDGKSCPQLDYPSLLQFAEPSAASLQVLADQTHTLFQRKGYVDYYFPNFLGSLDAVAHCQTRVLVNLNPNGFCDVFETVAAAYDHEKKWRIHCLRQQGQSETCLKCDWVDACKFHSGFWRGIRYDWCSMRKTLYGAIFSALQESNGADGPDRLSEL